MLCNAIPKNRRSEQNHKDRKNQGKDQARYEKEGSVEHTYVCHAMVLSTVSSTRKGGTSQGRRNPATEPTCWDSNGDLTLTIWRNSMFSDLSAFET